VKFVIAEDEKDNLMLAVVKAGVLSIAVGWEDIY